MAQYVYEPWYMRRRPPIFCSPCIPVYHSVHSTRRLVLIVGALLWCLGLMILLGIMLTCIAVHCGAVLAALLPISLILLIIGALLFHCGWAAHLLGEDGLAYGRGKTTTTTTTTETVSAEEEMKKKEQAMFEVTKEDLDKVKQGHWQFNENDSWQNVSSRDQLQQTVVYMFQR